MVSHMAVGTCTFTCLSMYLRLRVRKKYNVEEDRPLCCCGKYNYICEPLNYACNYPCSLYQMFISIKEWEEADKKLGEQRRMAERTRRITRQLIKIGMIAAPRNVSVMDHRPEDELKKEAEAIAAVLAAAKAAKEGGGAQSGFFRRTTRHVYVAMPPLPKKDLPRDAPIPDVFVPAVAARAVVASATNKSSRVGSSADGEGQGQTTGGASAAASPKDGTAAGAAVAAQPTSTRTALPWESSAICSTNLFRLFV